MAACTTCMREQGRGGGRGYTGVKWGAYHQRMPFARCCPLQFGLAVGGPFQLSFQSHGGRLHAHHVHSLRARTKSHSRCTIATTLQEIVGRPTTSTTYMGPLGACVPRVYGPCCITSAWTGPWCTVKTKYQVPRYGDEGAAIGGACRRWAWHPLGRQVQGRLGMWEVQGGASRRIRRWASRRHGGNAPAVQ